MLNDIFNFMLLALLLFALAVSIRKLMNPKLTWKEVASRCLREFFKMMTVLIKKLSALLEKPTKKEYFPVFIGRDPSGYFSPFLTENYFSPFKKIWEIVDFDVEGYLTENVIFYRFTCIKLKQKIDYPELEQLIQKMAESSLKKHLKDYGFLNVPVQQLIAVRLINDIVTVYIACTSDGLKEIHNIRKEIKKAYQPSKEDSTSSPIKTDWKDE